MKKGNETSFDLSLYRRYYIMAASAWTFLIAGLLLWGIAQDKERTHSILLSQAKPFFEQIIVTRSWNARHGGVYVPVTKENPPNPYLNVPNRDVETTNGLKLTLVNPAYMTRQISEIAVEKESIAFHLTSLHLVHPANAPEPWEKEAMLNFEKPGDEFSMRWQDENGKHKFRYMAPVFLEKACERCHAQHGYSTGDYRGGLSITLPADEITMQEQQEIKLHTITYGIIWLLGLIGITLTSKEINNRAAAQDELIQRLESTLRGMVPICSSCKSIRNESGEWEQLEEYIGNHSEAQFSHGICPVCKEEIYGDYLRKKRR